VEDTEQQRHQVFVWFEEQMGPERATTMMNLLPPVGWSDLATKGDIGLLKDDIGRVRGEMLQMEQRLDHRMEALEARVNARIDAMGANLLRTFGTLLFASQAAVITLVGVLVAILVAVD
jgi:hypothetical protein